MIKLSDKKTIVCTDCNTRKKTSEFNKRMNYYGNGRIYIFHFCRKCSVLKTKQWTQKNRKAHNKYQREYRKKVYWAMSKKQRKIFNKKIYQYSARYKNRKSK